MNFVRVVRDRNASEQPGEFQNFGNPFPGRERDYKLKFYRLITSGGRPVGNYLISIPGFVGMGERGRKGGGEGGREGSII